MKARTATKKSKPPTKPPKAIAAPQSRGKGGAKKQRFPTAVGGKGRTGQDKSKSPTAAPSPPTALLPPVDRTSYVLPSSQPVPASLSLRLEAVAREFAMAPPPPGAWGEWIGIMAEKFAVTVDQVEHKLERLLSGFAAEVKSNLLNAEARSLAMAIGATRSRALQVYREGMEAVKEVGGGMTVDGKIVLPLTVPDHGTRIKAADRVMQVFAMAAPTKVEHEVEVGDKYAQMQSDEMVTRLLGMLGDLGWREKEGGVVDVEFERVGGNNNNKG